MCVVLYLRESELLGVVEVDLAFQVQRERKAFLKTTAVLPWLISCKALSGLWELRYLVGRQTVLIG